jgi:hypothetical protein
MLSAADHVLVVLRRRMFSLSQTVRCPQREQSITPPMRDDDRNV